MKQCALCGFSVRWVFGKTGVCVRCITTAKDKEILIAKKAALKAKRESAETMVDKLDYIGLWTKE